MTGDIQEWFRGLPPLTRYWFALSAVVPLAGRFGILPLSWIFLEKNAVMYEFQLWRPFTGVFVHPTNFAWLLQLYFLYSYSNNLETGIFAGRLADYAFMMFFSWVCVVAIAMAANILVIMPALVMCVVYLWCMINRDEIVQFWFGTQFKAMYMPWVLFAFSLIIHNNGSSEIIGILVGHLYFFLTFKYPQDFGGPSLLSTPDIFYRWFPSARSASGDYGTAPAGNDARPRGGGHTWGSGFRLGGT